ncbi:MAG: D-alanine--D-alanine ligase [Actinomycetia bacterium]|nr:D-alanine--D-alanine ligase [Actinomycetes bacterium]
MEEIVTHPDVLVLCGGLSPERDVSIRSGRRVAEALRAEGLSVAVSDVDSQLLSQLTEDPPACVLPLLHGAAGEDGSLGDVLNTLDLAYVGSAPAAARLAFDKPVAKAIASGMGLTTPADVALPHAMFRELGADPLLSAVVARLGLPLMVKPAKGGSSLGASTVHAAAELPAAMVGAFAYGDVALVEQFVSGVEIAVGVIELDNELVVLPAVEIVPDGGIYDYNARYIAGMTEFFTPARLTQAQTEAAADIARAVHAQFGLRDYSRVDLIVSDDEVFFIEANVAPGMTETSLLPQALSAAGLTTGGVFAKLVAQAIDR